MTDKLDVKVDRDSYQAKRGQFRILEVPVMQYLMVDGRGDPNTSAHYREAVNALYPVAYAMKFASKQHLGRDYVVPPLEGLWWARDMEAFTLSRDKSQWDWTMMIMAPEWIDRSHFEQALAKVGAKDPPVRLGEVRLESLSEGLCVQTLHVGSYDDEAPVLAALHEEFIPRNGLRMTGKHHEIYLSDPRKVTADKLRTILRQPVQQVLRRDRTR